MALIKSKEKKERALGVSLGLKAHRCGTAKCALVRKPYKPGPHGKNRRGNLSEFGQQLAEKQKIMISYGLRETQMRKMFNEASRKKESISESIIGHLERRLDNVVFRLGFAPSRITSRQYIGHGHFLVNGRKMSIPSYQVKINDVISIKPSSKDILIFRELPTTIKQYEAPTWLSIDKEKMEGKVKVLPHGIEIPFDINLVVDYYSR